MGFQAVIENSICKDTKLINCAVPILKLKLEGVSVDISINGVYPIANSDLIWTFTQIDDRFR